MSRVGNQMFNRSMVQSDHLEYPVEVLNPEHHTPSIEDQLIAEEEEMSTQFAQYTDNIKTLAERTSIQFASPDTFKEFKRWCAGNNELMEHIDLTTLPQTDGKITQKDLMQWVHKRETGKGGQEPILDVSKPVAGTTLVMTEEFIEYMSEQVEHAYRRMMNGGLWIAIMMFGDQGNREFIPSWTQVQQGLAAAIEGVDNYFYIRIGSDVNPYKKPITQRGMDTVEGNAEAVISNRKLLKTMKGVGFKPKFKKEDYYNEVAATRRDRILNDKVRDAEAARIRSATLTEKASAVFDDLD